MSEISSEIYEAPQTITRMLALSQSLLYTLTPGLRRQAEFPMDDPSRLDWDFIPKSDRKGVPIAVLDRHQRTIAQTLIRSALSMRGYTKALGIMAMENVLRELEVGGHGVIAGDFRSQYPDSRLCRPARSRVIVGTRAGDAEGAAGGRQDDRADDGGVAVGIGVHERAADRGERCPGADPLGEVRSIVAGQ